MQLGSNQHYRPVLLRPSAPVSVRTGGEDGSAGARTFLHCFRASVSRMRSSASLHLLGVLRGCAALMVISTGSGSVWGWLAQLGISQSWPELTTHTDRLVSGPSDHVVPRQRNRIPICRRLSTGVQLDPVPRHHPIYLPWRQHVLEVGVPTCARNHVSALMQ